MNTLFARFAAHLDAVLDQLEAEGALPTGLKRSAITVEPPRDASHGDMATNAAMVLAKPDQAWRLALIATVTSVLGGVFGWMIGHYAFDLVAAPLLEFYGKMAAFDTLKSQTGDTAILVMLVTSGLTHLPPMKVVTILSGLVSFDLKWFILSAIVARGGRFYLLAYLLQRYGQAMAVFIEKRMALIGLALLAGINAERGRRAALEG